MPKAADFTQRRAWRWTCDSRSKISRDEARKGHAGLVSEILKRRPRGPMETKKEYVVNPSVQIICRCKFFSRRQNGYARNLVLEMKGDYFRELGRGLKSEHQSSPALHRTVRIMYIMLNHVLCQICSSVSNPTYLRSNPHKTPFPRNSKAWVRFIILSLRMALH